MKATRKNLHKIWFSVEKPMDLFKFWDSINFFKWENWQRYQNMKSWISKYDLYLNWPQFIDIEGKEKVEHLVILKTERSILRIFVYVFDPAEREIYKRIVKKIWTKDNALCMKIWNVWHPVNI